MWIKIFSFYVKKRIKRPPKNKSVPKLKMLQAQFGLSCSCIELKKCKLPSMPTSTGFSGIQHLA
jgi:hypothetical protein